MQISPSRLHWRVMVRADVDRLLKLPADERLAIAQALWESVAPEDEVRFLAIPGWQRQLLDERIKDLDESPGDEQPWEEARAELRSGA